MAVNPLAIGGGVVAAAAVVGGGLYAGGVFGGGKEVKTPAPTGRTIHWQPLSEDDNYNTKITQENEYKDKYGQTYGKYLTGTDTKNNDWWKNVFTKKYSLKKTTIKDKFTNSLEDENALKNKCVEAYKAKSDTSGIIKATPTTGNEANEFLESNIWEFCSDSGEKIQLVSEVSNGEEYTTTISTFGTAEANKKLLVSTTSTKAGNNWFWKHKQEKLTKEEKDTLKKDVKEWCKEIYKKTGTTAEDPFTKDNLFKFCSLSGTTPNN